jgi:hypothetical protein
MRMDRMLIPLALWGFAQTTPAQTMVLQGGQLNVSEGTAMTFTGAITWQIAPGAAVVNDGTIDLGDSGTLDEAPGAAITGNGIETTSRLLDGPLSNEEPGGLGLLFTHDQGPGMTTLTRGHAPITTATGSSMARWYELACEPIDDIALTLRYDPSELNGLNPGTLQLHRFATPPGHWEPLTGLSDVAAHTVTGTAQAPWERITAFHSGMTTDVADVPAVGAPWFRVYPTITTGPLWIEAPAGTGVAQLELFDMTGRRYKVQAYSAGTVTHLDVAHLSSGTYVLRINGNSTHRLVKP